MNLFARLTRAGRVDLPGDGLYRAIVAEARTPDWYVAGAVPDSVDGRFDAVALVLALVLLRLEREGPAEGKFSADLTERFIADMDGSLRELGIGDQVIGKHVGKMVGALGGRLGAYREALAGAAPLAAALERNLYRGEVAPDALAWSERRVRGLVARIDGRSPTALHAGTL